MRKEALSGFIGLTGLLDPVLLLGHIVDARAYSVETTSSRRKNV